MAIFSLIEFYLNAFLNIIVTRLKHILNVSEQLNPLIGFIFIHCDVILLMVSEI